MLLGVPGLRKAIVFGVLLAVTAALIACSGKITNPNTTVTSGLKFRAFVSNPVFPNSSGTLPLLNIVDASKDELFPFVVSLSSLTSTSIADPGLMAVSPDRKFTLVYSSSEHSIGVVDNTKESFSTGSGTNAIPAISLPDSSESMLIGLHDERAYAAVPAAPVAAIPPDPGAIEVIDMGTGTISGTIPIAGVRYIFQSHDGNHILALSDSASTVTLIAPSLIGTATDPRATVLGSFDRPVWAAFSSDDSTAYVLNCGPECGGSQASVSVIDVRQTPPVVTATITVRGATVGLLNGNTLYVAGTPPSTECDTGSTAAQYCGTVDVVNVGTQTVTEYSALVTDGYHTRMELGANGKIFLGARGCSNVVASGSATEVRGCLSIFNTNNNTVFFPPQIGDVTGIQPIDGRNVVYVCQNHHFWIYDTTTDQTIDLKLPTGVLFGIVGNAVDVKLVDF
jgi:hypothetical protein